VAKGPLIITDLKSLGSECSHQSLALVHGEDLDTEIEGPFSIHGGRLVIPTGYELFFVQTPQSPQPKAAEPEASKSAKPSSDPAKTKDVSPPKPPAVSSAKPGATPIPAAVSAPDLEPTACGLLWSGYVPYPDDSARSGASRMGNPYRRR
jgi:hypothetical protein